MRLKKNSFKKYIHVLIEIMFLNTTEWRIDIVSKKDFRKAPFLADDEVEALGLSNFSSS